MKATIYIFVFLLFIVSCDSGVDSNNFVSSDGFINKIEVSSWMYGTHTLNDSQGKVLYALKSSNYDLYDYNDKKVHISGYKIDGYPVGGGPIYVDVRTIKIIQ